MGWSQYYSFVVSKKIFNTLDSLMHRKLLKWAVFRHPKKGKCWIKRKYFKKHDKKIGDLCQMTKYILWDMTNELLKEMSK